DLSGRGVLVYEAHFNTSLIGNFPVEMIQHFFLSLADHLEAAIHLKVTGSNAHHMVEGLFKAFAKALNQAISKTGNNNVPSTKGTL
ncbi:MAG: imidazoleglycerol-phosphate dehydratase HisB, partial [Burkholderiales bacterium]|nr:imidazoleglycerol-phosphate dehydratase HisB [Burkholderiales bacterium]